MRIRAIAAMVVLVLAQAWAADDLKYFVGGADGSETHIYHADNWALSSGGVGGAGFPVTGDTLVFDDGSPYDAFLNQSISVGLVQFLATWENDFDDNDSNIVTVSGFSYDAASDTATMTLGGTQAGSGDGNYALEAGPTYAINALSFDTDLQGTGNFVIGGTTTIHKLSCAAAGKVTTKSSAGTLNMQQLTLGAGEFAIAVSQIIVKAKATADLSFNASHSVTGAGQLQLQVNAVVDLVLPLVNASGHSGVLVLGGASKGTHSMTLGGALNNGGITRIRKTGTGVFTFGTGNYNIASAGSFEIVSRSAVGSYTANLGSSTIDLATDWDNSSSALGGVTINAQTATIQIGDDFTLDATHDTWVAGTETFTANGTTAAIWTLGGNTIGDVELDKSANGLTLGDDFASADLTLTDGTFDMDGNAAACADFDNSTADATTMDGALTVNGDGTYTTDDTYAELLFGSTGQTHTITAAKTVTITTYTSGDQDGAAGALNEWASATPGTAALMVAPAGMTVSYMTFTDIDNSGGTEIDASDGTNVDGGGNVNIKFASPSSGGSFGAYRLPAYRGAYQRKSSSRKACK